MNIESKTENPFNEARFNLIWKFIYSLSILFTLLIIIYLFQWNFENIFTFLTALILNIGCLIYLKKTKSFKPIYFIIGSAGILFPMMTLITIQDLLHFGDFIWLIVAVLLTYFGLGSRIGKFYAFFSILVIITYISFFVNINLENLKPLAPIDKVALAFELIIAFSIIFYITYQYTLLHSISENKILNSNQELEIQNQQIKKQNHEKEILLKEIHHRVKNNMQIISSLMNLQSKSINDDTAISVLKESQGRIKTMMLLHQRLYLSEQNFSTLNFKTYLSDLVEDIDKTLNTNKNKTEINIEIPEITIDIDTAIPIGLIVNELCTNAYKYALSENGKLRIKLSIKNENEICLEIADNGPGLKSEFNSENANTFGFRLILMLIKQLKAEINYTFENGAKFVITFPIKEKSHLHET
jgi:two-component sensor histidine kinase